MNASPVAPRYVAGGTVQAGDGVYVERAADHELLKLCREGAFAYVLTSRQMGKSSLMIRTAEKLQEDGIKPLIIDLTELGATTTADQWYRGVLEKLAQLLDLRTSVGKWWGEHQHLSVAQRFNQFLTDVVLQETSERVVVFIDEIDTTLRLDFTDDFFASIRYLYNARATTKAFARLSFVLLGVASPGDLMKDRERTPFNIGQRVELDDFSVEDAVRDLYASPEQVRSVFKYTDGHPFLTLRVFRSLGEQPLAGGDIETRIVSLFYGEEEAKDSNLQFVRDMLTKRAPDREGVLVRYLDVWRGKRVLDKEADPVCVWLRLSGVVRRGEGGLLVVRNQIYRTVFDAAWVRKNRKANWPRRAAWAAGIAISLLISIAAMLAPFAYRQARDARAAARAAELSAAKARNAQQLESRSRLSEEQARQEAENAAAFARDAQRNATEEARRAAEAESRVRQLSQIATARGLTAQSLLLRAQRSDRIRTYFLLALESFAHSPSSNALQGLAGDLPLLRRSRNRFNHQTPVTSVAFSPDGRRLATGSTRLVRVYDTATGRELASLSQQGPVHSLIFSPDGRLLASGNADRASVFETATWKEVKRLDHPGPVHSLAFGPGGERLASASSDNFARVFETAAWNEVDRLEHKGGVRAVAFSPDGQRLAVANAVGQNGVFEIDAKRLTPLVVENQGSLASAVVATIPAVSFSPDGQLVAIGDARGTLMYNATTGEQVDQLTFGRTLSVSFSPDGQLVASGTENNTTVVFNVVTQREVARIPLEGAVNSVAFSPDGQLIATGSQDAAAQVFENTAGEDARRMGTPGLLHEVGFTPDGRLIVVGSETGWLSFFDGRSGERVARSPNPEAYDSRLMPGGRFLLTSRQNHVAMFATDTGTAVEWLPQGSQVVVFSPDGGHLASRDSDGTVHLFESASGKELARFSNQTEGTPFALSPGGRWLAMRRALDVGIVEPRSGREVARIAQQGVGSVAFSSDGQLVAIEGDELRLFESGSGTQVVQFGLKTGRPTAPVQFSPRDRFVVAQGIDGLQVFQSRSARELFWFPGPLGSVAISRDERLMAVSNSDSVRVFDLASGKELSRLDPGSIFNIAFSPDGRLLAMEGAGVVVLPWRAEDIVAYVCSHLSGNLTREEWKEYLPDEPYRKTCANLP